MNNVTLIGRLTRDPELKYLANSGTPVATFGIAVDRPYTNKEGKKNPDFINIEVWNKPAENCATYISKGSLVGIQGSIRVDSYKDAQGVTKSYVKVRANDVRFLSSKSKTQYQANPQQPMPTTQFTPDMQPYNLQPEFDSQMGGHEFLESDMDIPFIN